MTQRPGLYINYDDQKGRGVFTSKSIEKGEIIEICPVIVIPKIETSIIHKTTLHDYYFVWGHQQEEYAIALGYGSLYNHAKVGNAHFILDIENMTIDFEAIETIKEGEEILVNYNGEQGDATQMWWE